MQPTMENLIEIEEQLNILTEVEVTVIEFKEELESIEDLRVRDVAQEIIKEILENNKISRKTIEYTKKATKIARSLCDSRGYTNLAKDIITAAALMHELYIKKYNDMHVFMVRYNHQSQLRRLEPALAENICSIIEAHHGYESIVPKVASKEGTIEQILTDAVVLAKNL